MTLHTTVLGEHGSTVAFCHGLLAGWDIAACARAGNAAGAIVASRLMCADDMPTLGEIEVALAG